MRPSIKYLVAGLAMVVSNLSTTELALADANLNCSAYATAAVEQQNQNVALGCGLTGGAWHTDFQRHFNWCVQPNVKMTNLTTEDNYRKNALAQCTARRASCESYASSAVAAQSYNMQNNCGFTGGAWHSDYQRHFGWCMTAEAHRPGQETLTRNMHIQQCK